jgi:hypothetical protein
MALEWLVSRKSSTLSVKFAVGLMLSGALLAGANDLNFELLAYAIVMLYNVFTAAYLVLVNHISATEKERGGKEQLKSWDMMFYNNLISVREQYGSTQRFCRLWALQLNYTHICFALCSPFCAC